ncbi:Protein FAM127C [Ceratocystis platani]|uniref:Protein FAM127C n=1 Tax=Ceratocystis fimbriata f. sp. platani TaxID=88771 RepID=A0A0F8BNN3_CERFI|nr:Protein FAM127C [Ceratocystis platani]
MSDRLLPPFMPDGFKSFHAHISSEPEEWLKYFQAIYNYAELRSALTTESAKLQDQTTAHEADQKALLTTQAKLDVLKEQLKEQRQEAQDQISKARQNEGRALDMVQARTPRAASAPVRDPALETGEDPLFTETTSSSHRSERLPDPDKFDGNRQDLRRFVSQIHQKMTTNHDRFPTAQSRMAYVNNRLKGPAYALILPYVQEGYCQLSDYQEVLKVLDRAYGEPDQMNRARTELLHHDPPPPSYEYHQFANFLQALENRMNRFGFTTPFNTPAPPLRRATQLQANPSASDPPIFPSPTWLLLVLPLWLLQ